MERRPERIVHAAVFDLWGTLIHDVPERGQLRRRTRYEGIARVFAEVGAAFGEDDIARALSAVEPEIERIHATGRDLSAADRARLIADSLRPGLARALGDEVWPRFVEAERQTMLAYPPLLIDGAIEALDQARAFGLRLALVSNTGPTPGVVLREVLQQLGLMDFFDSHHWSDEVGWWKPAPEIYELATEALGIAPANAVFLGDTPDTDILGALRAGMWAVQIGNRTADGIEPHARIDSPADFWAALADLDLELRDVNHDG
jgi:putative hydrolase of the HAD superfamily